MRKFNQRWFWALVIIGFLPTVIQLIYRQYANLDADLGPVAQVLAVVVILGLLIWAIGRLGLLSLLRWPLIGLGRFLGWLLFGSQWSGARWMNSWEAWRFFSWMNKGWLVDGKSRRISKRVSFMGCLTIAAPGTGKSTIFVLPNLYKLAQQQCSIFVTDPSGELYAQSSGYLRRKGFKVQVLNLMNLQRSHSYNPLASAKSFTEVAQLANLLIRSSPAVSAKGDDAYWVAGAEVIIRVIIQALKNQGDPAQTHLARVKELLNQFDHFRADGKPSVLDAFILENTLADPATWNAYKGFLAGPEKAVASFVSTANTALMALDDPSLGHLLSTNEIDFTRLRKEKTVFYLIVRQQDMTHFSFVLSACYTQLFNALLHDLNPLDLPVFALLDEWGQCYAPDFDKTVTVGRKYRLAIWVFLQSQQQLEARYTPSQAKTILDGLRTEIYLAGMELSVAERLTRRLGKKRQDTSSTRIENLDANLRNPDELITMKDDQALLLYGNKRPFKYRVLPFFRHWKFRQLAKIKPAKLPMLGRSVPDNSESDEETEHSIEAPEPETSNV